MRVALKNYPDTHLRRDEPVDSGAESAQAQGGNLFDQLGNFLGRLFGGDDSRASAPAARGEKTSSADDGAGHAIEQANMAASGMAPQPSPPPEQHTETFVFQNGDTGERQVFRTQSAPYPGGENAYAYRERVYDPPPPIPPR